MNSGKRLFTLVCALLAALGVLSVLAAVLFGMGLVPPVTAEAASLADVLGIENAPESAVLAADEKSAEDKVASLASSAALLTPVVALSPKMSTTPIPKRATASRAKTRTRGAGRRVPTARTTASRGVSRPSGSYRLARASWYGPGFYGNTMAGGGKLTRSSMVVAHKSLPFGTRLQISYNGRTVTAVVRDRGPYIAGREFDLGPGVARTLGFQGVHTIGVKVLGR